MKINNEEWNEIKSFPQPMQKCKILILREATYIGKTEEGNFEFKVDEKGTHQVIAWKEREASKS